MAVVETKPVVVGPNPNRRPPKLLNIKKQKQENNSQIPVQIPVHAEPAIVKPATARARIEDLRMARELGDDAWA